MLSNKIVNDKYQYFPHLYLLLLVEPANGIVLQTVILESCQQMAV